MLNKTLMRRAKFNELHVYVFSISSLKKLNVLTPASIMSLGV